MTARLIVQKLESIVDDFEVCFGFPMWEKAPVDKIADLNIPVADIDGFRSRIISLVSIFDNLNKTQFDKITTVQTQGSRNSLIAFLKFKFKDDNPEIETSIEKPLGMISLLRTHLAHGKVNNFKKSYDYLSIPFPIEDPDLAWSRILFTFGEVLDVFRKLISDVRSKKADNREIASQALQGTLSQLWHRYEEYWNDSSTGPMLREILHEKNISDENLAKKFNIELSELRSRLYPLVGNMVRVSPLSLTITNLSIVHPLAQFLENHMFSGAQE
jgi:hypothetical protein